MKSGEPTDTRNYSMRKRARKARELTDRILDAAYEAFRTSYVSDVSLASIAEEAGCSEQTIYRKFGSKDGLIRALGQREEADMAASRNVVEVGDVEGAVERLISDYEAAGDMMILIQAQVDRVEPFREIHEVGREQHHRWVSRVFEPWLAHLSAGERKLAHGQLVVALDVQTWRRLRRELEFSAAETRQAMRALADAVLDRVKKGGSR